MDTNAVKKRFKAFFESVEKKYNFNLAWFVRYAAGGTFTVIVEWTVYFLLRFFRVYYLTASVIGNLASYVVNYFISKYWVFHSPETSHVRDTLLFVVCNGVNLAAVTALTRFTVGTLGLHEVIGKIIANFIAFLIVLVFKRYIIWTDSEKY